MRYYYEEQEDTPGIECGSGSFVLGVNRGGVVRSSSSLFFSFLCVLPEMPFPGCIHARYTVSLYFYFLFSVRLCGSGECMGVHICEYRPCRACSLYLVPIASAEKPDMHTPIIAFSLSHPHRFPSFCSVASPRVQESGVRSYRFPRFREWKMGFRKEKS